MSTALATNNKTEITLQGSVAIVSEFFFTAINSILYQRGIYQPETFKREVKYGLTVLTSTDAGLLNYLNQVMGQMESWLLESHVQRLVVVVTGIDSEETLERWQFNVHVEEDDEDEDEKDGSSTHGSSPHDNNDENQRLNTNSSTTTTTTKSKSKSQSSKKGTTSKSIKQVHNEIQAIIRQITASVTFLPLLNEPCSFDLLVYTNKEASVPKKWEDSDPRYIMNSQEVKLRSFTTSVHKVDSMVTYKEKDEWEL
mmetsp:Transcript_21505/g.33145  ORF Transcript_21505/g.33145 Transcript_21505/m.33145 type:complete len:254 (+) Transcript_21505:283-1044(+)|eukprot:CAMPEP_0195307746 /NCGR_PEP_ID=MMETSP0707-20130614/37872_1 /TAXON_ID=33640 /ORGANISM="Asterionellopsis glacialis, Strain CCMP134" /LENGTH=253 /DNA_ID=CAMNT_0040371999 /DNA_START=107 /DNA_END=868 /DNA_ORIENTATION=+